MVNSRPMLIQLTADLSMVSYVKGQRPDIDLTVTIRPNY